MVFIVCFESAWRTCKLAVVILEILNRTKLKIYENVLTLQHCRKSQKCAFNELPMPKLHLWVEVSKT